MVIHNEQRVMYENLVVYTNLSREKTGNVYITMAVLTIQQIYEGFKQKTML